MARRVHAPTTFHWLSQAMSGTPLGLVERATAFVSRVLG